MNESFFITNIIKPKINEYLMNNIKYKTQEKIANGFLDCIGKTLDISNCIRNEFDMKEK